MRAALLRPTGASTSLSVTFRELNKPDDSLQTLGPVLARSKQLQHDAILSSAAKAHAIPTYVQVPSNRQLESSPSSPGAAASGAPIAAREPDGNAESPPSAETGGVAKQDGGEGGEAGRHDVEGEEDAGADALAARLDAARAEAEDPRIESEKSQEVRKGLSAV
eukprot:2835601-Rhodomonas_salina.7